MLPPTQLRADECFEYKNTDVFFLSALALQTLKQNVRSVSCVNNTNIKMAVISIARYLTDKSEHTALFKITLNLQYTFTHIIWYFSYIHAHACGSGQKEGRGGELQSGKAEDSLESAVVVLFVEASLLLQF